MGTRNWLLFMLVALLWSSNWVVIKSGLTFVGPMNFVSQRLFFASLALAPFLAKSRGAIPRSRATWMRLLLLSVTNAVGILSSTMGLLNEKSGVSAVMTYTQPLFVFCLAAAFLRGEVDARRMLGVVTGFFGVAVLYLGGRFDLGTASYSGAFLLFGAFLWAVSTVYYKKELSHVDPLVTNSVQLAVGALLLFMPAIALERFSFSGTIAYVFIILYSSVGASAVAFTLWILLVKQEEATAVSTSSFIIPIFALLFGCLFLDEGISLESLLGIALILTGVYLANNR